MGYKCPIQSVMNSPAQIISTLWPTTPLLLIYNFRDHHTTRATDSSLRSAFTDLSLALLLAHSLTTFRSLLQRHLSVKSFLITLSKGTNAPSTFSRHLPYCCVFSLWLIVCLFVQECKLHTYKVFCHFVHHWISNYKVSVLCFVLNTHKMNNEYLLSKY